MTGLNVNLGDRSYKIQITNGFDGLGKVLSPLKQGKALLVTDSNIDKLYSEYCMEQIRSIGAKATKFVFPAGEKSKNLETIKDIYRVCKENKFERHDTIVALGGGVVGDLAGFAASTYLRGVNLVQVPTSLVAQCDSSVGGKVGVDFEGAKNLVGNFYQPRLVYINIDTLKSLPEREYISGLAEVIKHGIIQDLDFFRYLEDNITGILAREEGVLSYVVRTNCTIKARIVEIDEKESYLRAILNFGHTVGHAIESVLEFSLLHGECVSLGMVAASDISRSMKLMSSSDIDRIKGLLKNLNLPTSYKDIEAQKVLKQMYLDKKISGGRLNFILPKRIGEVVQFNEVPEETILRAIKQLSSQ